MSHASVHIANLACAGSRDCEAHGRVIDFLVKVMFVFDKYKIMMFDVMIMTMMMMIGADSGSLDSMVCREECVMCVRECVVWMMRCCWVGVASVWERNRIREAAHMCGMFCCLTGYPKGNSFPETINT